MDTRTRTMFTTTREGEQTGHEEAGHAANTAHAVDAGHGHGHGEGTGSVHKSPPSMMWPLYILAVPSLLFGIMVGPTHIFENFLEPSVWSYARTRHIDNVAAGRRTGPASCNSLRGYIISSLVAIAGLYLAFSYLQSSGREPANGSPKPPKRGWLRNPRHSDRVSVRYLCRQVGLRYRLQLPSSSKCGGWFAENVLWKIVDKGIIDNIVNGFAGLVGVFSQGYTATANRLCPQLRACHAVRSGSDRVRTGLHIFQTAPLRDTYAAKFDTQHIESADVPAAHRRD